MIRPPLLRLWCKIAGTSKRSLLRLQTSSPKHWVPDHRCSSALNARRPSPNFPLRMRYISLMPAIVIVAFLNPWKPHHSNALLHAPFRYFDERSFVLAEQPAIGFKLARRTVRCRMGVMWDTTFARHFSHVFGTWVPPRSC